MSTIEVALPLVDRGEALPDKSAMTRSRLSST
jgi:hypothetical protein